MKKTRKITVQGLKIVIYKKSESDFISLTDIARFKNVEEPKEIVKNWIRTRSTIEFLGIWEKINNPNFKGVEFDAFKNEAGSNSFVLSPLVQSERLLQLNQIAITQMQSLVGNASIKKLK